jgi:hypothetical protein
MRKGSLFNQDTRVKLKAKYLDTIKVFDQSWSVFTADEDQISIIL